MGKHQHESLLGGNCAGHLRLNDRPALFRPLSDSVRVLTLPKIQWFLRRTLRQRCGALRQYRRLQDRLNSRLCSVKALYRINRGARKMAVRKAFTATKLAQGSVRAHAGLETQGPLRTPPMERVRDAHYGTKSREICLPREAGALRTTSVEGGQLNSYAARSHKMYSVIRQ